MIFQNFNKSTFIAFCTFAFVWIQSGSAQPNIYGNEWLETAGSSANSNQFAKIKVVEQGVYRVFYNELKNMGFQMGNLNPAEFQLWRRGIQQSIIVEDNGNNSFDVGDYIEFYGQGNDGELDKYLFFDTLNHIQEDYSEYTDTAAYILTLGSNALRSTEINGISTSYDAYKTEHIAKTELIAFGKYYYGQKYFPSNGLEYEPMAFGDRGEGWFSGTFGSGVTHTVSGVKNVAISSAETATLQIELVSAFQGSCRTVIEYKTTSDASFTLLDTVSMINYFPALKTYILNPTDLFDATNDGNVLIRFKNLDNDYAVFSSIKITFPQVASLASNNESFTLNSSPGSSVSLNLENGTSSTYIYDVTNEGDYRKISTEFIGGTPSHSRAKFNKRSFTENLFVSNQYLSAADIEKFTFIKNPDTLADYLIISHPRLLSSASEYMDYRKSTEGGNYNVEMTMIEDLYNTFSYGDYTPLAIRRYCRYQFEKGNAEFLFLLGKAFQQVGNGTVGLPKIYGFGSSNPNNQIAYRKRTTQVDMVDRFNASIPMEDLVPTAGNPGSDNWFTSKIDPTDNSWAPALATGRITALTNAEVLNYLNKVKEYELVPDTTAWKKEILHLAGGYSSNEISQIANSVAAWKKIAEGEHFGGNVSTISRPKLNNQSNISEINVSDKVNDGVHLITFFGHSNFSVTDIDIGRASNPINHYTNTNGKYPFILLNGCNSGNCFVRTFTFGEDWVNVESKGAIGFIGHSDIGLTSSLAVYTNTLYNAMFADTSYINTPIGIQIQEAIRNQVVGTLPSLQVAHALQMLYQGDPAIVLFTASKPDLAIENTGLFLEEIDGGGITAVSESFNLGIQVNNYGLYNESDSFYVSIKRVLGDGTFEIYPPKQYASIKKLDTIYYEIASKNINAFGSNQFHVHIDYNYDSVSAAGGASFAFNQNHEPTYEKGSIDEGHETNNEAFFQYYLPLSAVKPIFPREFSIINAANYLGNNGIDFTAQSTDLLITSQEYYIEMDTLRDFSEPLFTGQATGTSLVTWNDVPIFLDDTLVYYWRVRFLNVEEGEDTLWGESSFTYIPNSSEGWSQAHYQHFFRDAKEEIQINEDTRSWDYEEISNIVSIKTASKNYSNSTHGLTLNNENVWFQCNTGVRLIIIDPQTLNPVVFNFASAYICQSNPGLKYHYSYNLNSISERDDFLALLSVIPSNYIVALSSMNNPLFATWDASFSLSNVLASNFGTSQYPSSDSSAYAFVGCKDCLTPLFEGSHADTIVQDVVISAVLDQGSVTSTIIGPSLGWDDFVRNIQKDKSENTDSYKIDIYGLDINFEDSLLISNIAPGNTDLSGISATKYPYLQLRMESEDLTNHTPPQLNNWLVLYDDKVPEGVLISNGYDYSSKTYYEGEEMVYQFKFRNISKNDFLEPLVVRYAFSTSQEFTILKTDTLNGILKAGEEVEFEFRHTPTSSYGSKLLQVFVNPRTQVEQYYFNNIWQIPVVIEKDVINPLLDVVFDNVHIMNRDIISPTPNITMTMKDENQHIFKTDTTTGVELFWKFPGEGQQYQIIELENNPNLEFTPASKNQDFQIKYTPDRLEDGIHYLSVQIADASGNNSGVYSYEIAFEVINESSVSKFYPYPNPFSTSTRFAYTLTGTEVPGINDVKIQIMSLSGKMVRTITGSELGYLQIGKHLTDYAWDGTDEFGDKLANGVYLYRVQTKLNNQAIKERTANAFMDSNTFTKSWGKLYIMR